MPKTQTQTSESAFDSAALAATEEGALHLVQKAGARAEALVNAWVKANNAAAVNEVAERGDGNARKAARRGLNVLKSRGIAIPERKSVTNVTAPEQEQWEAWMLAPDSQGTVLMAIASRTATSRARASFVFLNANVGIQRVEVAEMSHSQFRESLANAIRGGDYKPVKVPVEYARFRVAEARKQQKERGILEPMGMTRAKVFLEPVPSEPVEHPFDGEGLELGDEDAKELAAQSGRLHTLPEFRGWFPPPELVNETLARLGQALETGKEPGQEPPSDLVQEKLEAELVAATDRYFTVERREALVIMMKDSALSILGREGEERALEVAAAIKVISLAGLITDPPHTVPFLRAFLDKAIGSMLAQNQGKLRIPIPKPPVVTE